MIRGKIFISYSVCNYSGKKKLETFLQSFSKYMEATAEVFEYWPDRYFWSYYPN